MTRHAATLGLLGMIALTGGCERNSPQDKATDIETSAELGTTTFDDAKREVSEAAKTSLDYASTAWADYKKAAAKELARLNEEIDEFQDWANNAGEDVNREFEQVMEDLKGKREAARRKLEDVRQRAPDAADDLREGFDAAMAELKTAFKKAKQKLGKDSADADLHGDVGSDPVDHRPGEDGSR